MSDAPRVVALLLNWRLPDETLSCVQQLRACGQAGLHVVLMDNGSGDGSSDRLREVTGPGVELLAFEQNLGYCAAMNRGVARALELGADYVLFLNNDVELPHGFLGPLIDVLDKDPSVACVGPTMLRPDGRVWAQGGSVAFHPNVLKLHGKGSAPAPMTDGPRAVGFMPGACSLYRLPDLDAAGRLDEDYVMYWEEVDLAERLRAAGKTVVWLPSVRITHHGGASAGEERSRLRKYMCGRNSVRWLRRWGAAEHWIAFAILDVLAWPLSFLSGTPPAASWAKLRGIGAGLIGRPMEPLEVERLATGEVDPRTA